jgi:phenylpyruvate tautomerase
MPMISIKYTGDVPSSVLSELSAIITRTMGKPEQYVMVSSEPAVVRLGGSTDPAAFVEVRSIGGLSASINRSLSQKICALLDAELHVPQNRTYITFESFSADSWGCNGTTFG